MKTGLNESERKRLLTIASYMEAEARTWAEGFALLQNGVYIWDDKEYGWAHVHYVKMMNSAAFLRGLAKSL